MTVDRISSVLLMVRLLREAEPVLGSNQILSDTLDRLKRASDRHEIERLDRAIWSIWGQAELPDAITSFEGATTALSRADFTGAMKELERTVILDPMFAEAWNRRATVYFVLGKHEPALSDYVRALVLEPRHYGALSGIGHVLGREGERKGAVLAFQTALSINPHLMRARTAIRRLQTA
jgi:tetratricopeptide (TPR) repeat protein